MSAAPELRTTQRHTPQRHTPQRRRRAEVLRVAAKLFAEQGYEATSTTDIAERLGIKGGSVYYYIESKEALLFELVEDIYGLLLESLHEVLDSDDDPLAK